ncbi:TetR/AcrR family transcriptional regulator [Agromyces bauzanensis]
MDRRTAVADAALEVVAADGMKGLTHRAVDAAAGVPPGTTSNHFRTREALVAAVAERLEERDLAVWSADRAGPPPADADAFAELLTHYLAVFATEHADLTRVRLTFSLDQPAAVVAGHSRFMAIARQLLEAAGVADAETRARWVADYSDGMLLHQLTARRGEPVDVEAHRRAIRHLLD